MERLEKINQDTQGELVKIGVAIEKIAAVETNFAKFEGETIIEIKDLKSWSKWALSVGILLLIAMGTTTATVVSNQNALLADIRNTSKNQDEDRKFARQNLAEQRKTVFAVNESVHEFSRSLDSFKSALADFNEKFKDQSTKINEIGTFVEEIKKSRGESFSEFATQRTLLTHAELRERAEKKGPLIFDIKPLPDSQVTPAASRSARPSAILAIPHDPILDRFGFQIKIKKIDDGTLQVRIMAQETTLNALEKFINQDKGTIPLELIVRTPIEQ